MRDLQYSIWREDELDIFAPKKKTKQQLRIEKREAIKTKLLDRIILQQDEFEKYNFSLKKEELIRTINEYNNTCESNFLNSKHGLADTIKYHIDIFSPGIPQMLLTSLSQYSKKEHKQLLVSDLIVMYKSLLNILNDESIKGDNFKKFRKANNLTFFGYKQFLAMDEYLKRFI
ncbi:MAG: hypothetical protein ACP5NZ_03740 [Nanobdellota archaeon]